MKPLRSCWIARTVACDSPSSTEGCSNASRRPCAATSTAERMLSDYWTKHRVVDEALREQLGLP